MRKHRGAEPKPWVSLGEPIHGFDNGNGADPVSDPVPGDREDEDVQDLIAKGVASSAVSSGFFGGGGF